MKNKTILLAIIVGLVFTAGCGRSDISGPEDTPSLGVPAQGSEDVQEMVVVDEGQKTGEIREFDITAKNWEFVPSTITVNEGDTVKLKITSTQGTHGFRLPDFGINEILEPGNTVEVEFVADKAGTFAFSCSVPCGSGHGRMSGQLIVK